jgi:hypothetical protein
MTVNQTQAYNSFKTQKSKAFSKLGRQIFKKTQNPEVFRQIKSYISSVAA